MICWLVNWVVVVMYLELPFHWKPLPTAAETLSPLAPPWAVPWLAAPDASVNCGGEPEPFPSSLDHFAERTDRDPFAIGRNRRMPFDKADNGGCPTPADPDGNRHSLPVGSA